ncbi:MAG: leucine-rich repeat domain-containing protein [Clostridia bacterium]|nr:leucine-rich repeat domain-containing protein [Clostridia bacterium]
MKRFFHMLALLLVLCALLCACNQDAPPEEHTHVLTAHEEKAATCAQAGHKAYWQCKDCNKYFSDAEGKTEVTDVFSLTTPALPHPFTWESNEAAHWRAYSCNCTVTADTPAAHVFEKDACSVCGAAKPQSSGSADEADPSGLEFFLNADGQSYSVSGIGEARANVVVESTYKGLPVTGIQERAFENCELMTSITLPEGLTTIGEWAFYNCRTLKSIHLPSTLETVGENAFAKLPVLETLTMASENQHYAVQSGMLIEKKTYTLLVGVGNQIPGGVTKIGEYAFNERTSLTAIAIPGSVTEIGASAFSGCKNLQSVTFSEGLVTIGGAAFASCDLQSLSLPNSLRTIKMFAFSDNRDLTHATIPKDVTLIEDYVLEGCDAMQSVTIPFVGNTQDDEYPRFLDLFGGSVDLTPTGLHTVTLTNTVHLGEFAFSGCTMLTTIHLPEELLSIGGYAFYQCSSLAAITLPNTLQTIGESAFSNCTSLIEIHIPASVTEIGRTVFFNCNALTSVTLAITSGWVELIGNDETPIDFTDPTQRVQYFMGISNPLLRH